MAFICTEKEELSHSKFYEAIWFYYTIITDIKTLLNALNTRLKNIKCMNMSDKSFRPDSFIYTLACPGIKSLRSRVTVFLRVVDGIKVWVNGQPVMSTVGYWIAKTESTVLWQWTHFICFFFSTCDGAKVLPVHGEEIIGCNFKKQNLKRRSSIGDGQSFSFSVVQCAVPAITQGVIILP